MIYLASQSPRRGELLRQIGVDYTPITALSTYAVVDETPESGEVADEYVLRLARAKAQAGVVAMVAQGLVSYPVLGADTTVLCQGRLLGKPQDRSEAEAMLTQLSGRSHQVLTAVVVSSLVRSVSQVVSSTVWFQALSAADIERYVDRGESMDKAGAYAVQGLAAAFINRIEGSYSGIMGLPLAETADLLRQHGILVP